MEGGEGGEGGGGEEREEEEEEERRGEEREEEGRRRGEGGEGGGGEEREEENDIEIARLLSLILQPSYAYLPRECSLATRQRLCKAALRANNEEDIATRPAQP